MRTPRQPSLGPRSLVHGAVVHDDEELQLGQDIPVDHLQEVEKLPGPVATLALTYDRAGDNAEGGEERGCTVAPG